ncbi:MAG TPA: S1 RNA-binding domain-containing protein, partial [Phycisphaeraceae bacterium]
GEAGKLQGIVPLPQFERPPRIGSIMDFVVERVDESQGLVFLSREGAVSRATWEQLQRGAAVEARVIATNKGGLEMEMVGGIRAFMPASQIDLHHVDDLESLVGQRLQGLVQEIDRRSKKVVISRRQLLQQAQEQARAKLLAELEPGQVREGVVCSLVDFGAFVDLGGVDGLVHISDLSYTHVAKPSEVLTVGQRVRVKVLKIDRDKPGKERISLGLKQVEPDPWDSVEGRLRPGEQVSGRVVRTTSFGAFVEILPGIEGLLPLSEMSWRRIAKAEDVVKVGDSLRLAVLSIDVPKRRISLSLKQAQGDPWTGAERKYPAQSVVEGKVLSTTDFGAFIELEPGVEGLVHISELSDRRVGKVQDVLNVGDVRKFRVLEISEDDRKVRLSLKQADKPAEPSPQQAQAAQEAASSASKPAAARKSTPSKPLKGGMGSHGGLGKGLGDLSLGDLKP